MAIQYANNPLARINKVKGEIVAHAMPHEVLALGMTNKQMNGKSGESIVYRRWLPYGGSTSDANSINRWSVDHLAHLTQEGVTPTADRLVPNDYTATIQQYSCLYAVSDKALDVGEDGASMPNDMKQMVGERIGLVREMVRYAALRACTNVVYAGGSSRASVSQKISLNALRRMARTLKGNHGKQITSVLAPSPNYATSAVEAAYLVFAHTDAESDIRDLPQFLDTAKYGQRRTIHEMEIGSCESFRFVLSAELNPYLGAGASASGTGLYSVGGSNVDVYPFIVMGKDAAYDIALRGKESVDVKWIPPDREDKNDPLGQRGYAGAKFYSAALVINNGWMGVIEAGVSDLS